MASYSFYLTVQKLRYTGDLYLILQYVFSDISPYPSYKYVGLSVS